MKKFFSKSCLSLILASIFFLSLQIPTFAATSTNSTPAIYADNSAVIRSDAYKNYSDFSKYLNLKYTFIMPGLKNTNQNGPSSNAMIPQGMCFAKDYVLLTAYDYYKGKSVIYLLSNSSSDYTNRKYLTTIVLPNSSHVGGIAYDGTNIWVSNGTSVNGIKYSKIVQAANSGKDAVNADIFKTLSVGTQASTLTYYNGMLWIATFNSNSAGSLISYTISGANSNSPTLTNKKTYGSIPAKTQGISMRDNKMILSLSYGRKNGSQLLCYNLKTAGDPSSRTLTSTINLPPMSEAVVMGSTYTYVVFESASAKYHKNLDGNGVGSSPVDRVCAFNTDDLFNKQ